MVTTAAAAAAAAVVVVIVVVLLGVGGKCRVGAPDVALGAGRSNEGAGRSAYESFVDVDVGWYEPTGSKEDPASVICMRSFFFSGRVGGGRGRTTTERPPPPIRALMGTPTSGTGAVMVMVTR